MKAFPTFIVLLAALMALTRGPAAAGPGGAGPDTLEFSTFPSDSEAAATEQDRVAESGDPGRTPFGDGLLIDRGSHPRRGRRFHEARLHLDYNRVDRLRLGIGHQFQFPDPMSPRFAWRLEYAFGRDRMLYGFQLEQPVAPPGRIALGVSLVRRTDHNQLQQVDDTENTLAMLLWRFDYRDYFERDGVGAYLSWRVPDFSTVSVHLRRDSYRSLPLDPHATSWFHRSRALRDNPAIDDGETHSLALRFEQDEQPSRHAHAGLYHWVEVERAGRVLGGDFAYTRMLGDLRSVIRLSPMTTLVVRIAAGHTAGGTLPSQKQFPVGGVDVLRAHAFGQFRGDQLALAQAEYSLGLGRVRSHGFEGGLHALAFVDAAQAWSDPRRRWNVGGQRFAVDGGFGFATGEDKLRIYLAKDLRDTDSDLVLSLRLHRPF